MIDTVLGKIKKAFVDLQMENIRPSLIVINQEDERTLFTEGSIPKANSTEDFFLSEFQVEVFIVVEDQMSEPTFYGNMQINPFHA